MAIERFIEAFGWHVAAIEDDMRVAYNHGRCRDCSARFRTMPLGDLTVDITDPRAEPNYSMNTRLICGGCNRRKGRCSPDQWARKLVIVQLELDLLAA